MHTDIKPYSVPRQDLEEVGTRNQNCNAIFRILVRQISRCMLRRRSRVEKYFHTMMTTKESC